MDAQLLVALRALVDASRLRIVGRLATGPADLETLATDLRQPVTSIARQVDMLVHGGLVERRPGARGRPAVLAARLDRVGELGRALAALEDGTVPGVGEAAGGLRGAWPHGGEPPEATIERIGATAEEVRVLRSFLVDGRLVTIPAQHAKRQVVLRFLLERVFTEPREYPEKEVNQRLALFHRDVASLRRYLVDDGYVTRAAGLYRRATGPEAPGERTGTRG